MAQIIQLRRGTTSQWASSSVILAEGELAFELRPPLAPLAKVGDGVTPWAALPYFAAGGGAGPGVVPGNSALPAITGLAIAGATLTATNGNWTNSPTSFAKQWRRNGGDIAGATGDTYVLVTADVGTSISVSVTASNLTGAGLPAVSVSTTTIIPAAIGTAPFSTASPFFANTVAFVGDAMTLTPGIYIGSPTPTITRQWRLNNVVLSGVTGTTYTSTAPGVYTVDETASNGVGSPITQSTAVGVTVTPVPVAPSAPQGFSAGAASDTTQVLNWVAPATGLPATYTYTITRRAGGGAYGNAVTTAAGATTATITGLTASTTYDYLIAATNTTGTGPTAALSGVATTAASGGADSVYATDVYQSGVYAT
jgi:hypothetical protein